MLPEGVAGTESVVAFLAHEISVSTYLNVMSQYYPSGKVCGRMFAEINRCITRHEFDAAVKAARAEGLFRFD